MTTDEKKILLVDKMIELKTKQAEYRVAVAAQQAMKESIAAKTKSAELMALNKEIYDLRKELKAE